MNTPDATEDLRARTQQEVVGIRQQNLRAGVVQKIGRLRLDRGVGAHRHEQRGANFVVQRAECRRPRTRASGCGIELKVKRSLQGLESSARIGCEIRRNIKVFPLAVGNSRALTPWCRASLSVKFKRQKN